MSRSARFEHADDVDVVHRSFELDPARRRAGTLTMDEAVAAKYGIGAERVAAGHEQLTELGAEVGLVFDFDRVQLGNTFDAHRLAQAARGHAERGRAGAAACSRRTSPKAGCSPTTTSCATSRRPAGLDDGVTEKVLGGDLFAREVRVDEAAAQERDVTGVPFFLINGAWPIPGAQDVETLVTVLRRAWSRSAH